MKTITQDKLILMTLAVDSDNSSATGKVILFNCNCHTFDAVILQITRAIHCPQEKALCLAQMADATGSSMIYKGPLKRCEKVADILASIGLKVAIEE